MIMGIDFGTTNSLGAYIDKSKKPEVIINERGMRLTPSIVFFKNPQEAVIGELARSQMLVRPGQTIFRVKRKMGTRHIYKIFDREYTPSEVGSLILRKIKKYTSEYLDKEVKKAVITVPAYFDDNQRQAVLQAAKLADIEIMKLLNEPTAAALAYQLYSRDTGTILVLDLGGGTFDITLMRCTKGLFEVLTTGGSTELGGADFDNILAKWVIETMKEKDNVDLSKDPIALQQIYNCIERTKVDLSTTTESTVVIPYIAMNKDGPIHVNLEISRERFENLTDDLFQKAKQLVISTLNEIEFDPDDVDIVVFAGGATRMPRFREEMGKIFKRSEIKTDINPDEVVALGAAVQAAIIEGRIKHVELKDILPHNLGILDDEGRFVPIIERGKVYPTVSTKIFTNTQDEQNTANIEILQERSDRIVSLGNFQFKSKSKWKKGEANIAVSFNIDGNGVLNVSAEDIDTHEAEEVIISNGILSLDNNPDHTERRGPGIKIL
ncbi:MAG: molecular chaperone DnaK [Thermotoga sp.]|nr:Hsp70 family protein [Thermotogota bacterium]RKX56043.1 MAG: molecular chaperone DnaK [Thermotoga sp.]